MYKSIGILGGMGPAATVDLMGKIINCTAAEDDQHHLHIYVDNNTSIPDRTAAILYGGKSPVPELVKSAKKLQAMGADVLIMPCNTAHHFYDEICAETDIPVLNMLRETAVCLAENRICRAGILATDGTVFSGIYENAFRVYDIEPIYPKPEHQKIIMDLCYRYVKKGIVQKEKLPVGEVLEVLQDLREKGVQKIILACTELPIAFGNMEIREDTVDPTMILAKAAIRFAGAQTIEN